MNLNQYLSRRRLFNKKIIVICAKDDASKYFSMLKFLKKYNLKVIPTYRTSYVAIIDLSNKYIYNESMNDKLEISYSICNNYIDIKSAGFLRGNIASVKIGGNEYSKNRRGLNVCVFDAKTLSCVDSFSCDLCTDKSLTIVR